MASSDRRRVVVEYDASLIPAQSAFHCLMEKKRFGLFLGGRQGGKTTAGAHQAWREIARNLPPRLGYIIGPTYAMTEVAERDFLAICPEAITRRREFGDRRIYDVVNGYRVEFRTADDPDKLRGARLAWYWADEIAMMKRSVVEILYPSLLAYRGKMWGTTTPRGRNWLYDEFYLRSLPGNDLYDPEYFCIRSRSSDNVFLSASDVDRLRRKYTGAFAAQEVDAEFVNFEGLVYRDFDVTTHVVPDLDPEDKKIEQVIAGIDFGFKDPFAYIWLAKKEGRWIAVDEHYASQQDTFYHARIIRSNPWERLVSLRFADPRAAQARVDLMRYGVPNIAAHKHEIMDGVLEVSRLLGTKMQDGKAQLLVAKRCKNLIQEFGQYRYKDPSDDKNTGEKPMDYMNHALDAMRYGIFSIGCGLYHGPKDAPPREVQPGDYGYIMEHVLNAPKTNGFLSRGRDTNPWQYQSPYPTVRR